MKRLLVWLLILALMLPASACAGGLGGLKENGKLSALTGEKADPYYVPDPAMYYDVGAGEVIERDYAFTEDFICTVYAYPLPEFDYAFEYCDAAETLGFVTEYVRVEGYEAIKLSLEDGRYALLIPDFDGTMLMLVQNGLSYGVPNSDRFYLSVTRNGEPLSCVFQDGEISCRKVTSADETQYDIEITGTFSNADISTLVLRFPYDLEPGDYSSARYSKLKSELYLYTEEEGRLVDYGSEQNRLTSEKDYLSLWIFSMYESEEGLVIGGEFYGLFDDGNIFYNDGMFHILLKE